MAHLDPGGNPVEEYIASLAEILRFIRREERLIPPLRGVARAMSGALCVSLCAACAPLTRAGSVASTSRPDNVLDVMQRVADSQLAHPSKHDPATWTQCAGYTGFMALAAISSDRRFHDAMLRMGQQNGWKLGAEGSRYLADDHCVGQVYAELYLEHGASAMIAPMRARFDWILAHPTNDNLSTDRARNPDAGTGWWWCDALFMAPAAWLRLAKLTGRAEYLDFMIQHWWQMSDYLYDPEEHLYFRDDRFFARREVNGRKVFWSRGNGWVMAGLHACSRTFRRTIHRGRDSLGSSARWQTRS